MINFEVFLVGKVPKSSVFNGECLENDNFWSWKNHENQKWVKLKNRGFAASRKSWSGQIKLCLRHEICRK